MIGQFIKAHIVSPVERFGLDILLYNDDMGRRSVAHYDMGLRQFIYEEHEPGKLINQDAYLRMSRDEARALYDGLSDIFDPPEASATTQKLEATEKHLTDTKALLNAVLPSALRESQRCDLTRPTVETNSYTATFENAQAEDAPDRL